MISLLSESLKSLCFPIASDRGCHVCALALGISQRGARAAIISAFGPVGVMRVTGHRTHDRCAAIGDMNSFVGAGGNGAGAHRLLVKYKRQQRTSGRGAM